MARQIKPNTKISVVTINDLDLVVLREVFPPHQFRASQWMTSKVTSIVGTKTFLEIGTGTGITALSCAKKGATVVATDISSEAVKNAKINALLNDCEVDVRLSDIFSAVEKSETFDVIFWNHPFDPSPREELRDLDRAIYDPAYASTEKYIRDGMNYLRKGGRLLLGTGMSADFEKLRAIASKHGLVMKEVVRETLPPRNTIKVPFDVMILEFVPIRKS